MTGLLTDKGYKKKRLSIQMDILEEEFKIGMAIIYRLTCSNDLCVGCCLISLFTEKLTKINRNYYHCMPGFDLPSFDLVLRWIGIS